MAGNILIIISILAVISALLYVVNFLSSRDLKFKKIEPTKLKENNRQGFRLLGFLLVLSSVGISLSGQVVNMEPVLRGALLIVGLVLIYFSFNKKQYEK